MTDKTIYIRLADAEAAIGPEALVGCERFVLHDGHRTNEAGIAELRDADGKNVEPDDRRWQNS